MSDSKAKKGLLKRRAELLGEIDDREDAIASVSIDDQEDKQIERLDDEVLSALSDVDRNEIIRIDAALKAIADGSYGICHECGQKISPQRLEAMPDATLCISCASAADARA